MRLKRILSALVSAALASALALPAGAAPSSFVDVSDPETAVNADILRLMGVVSGVGSDRFDPGADLSRAQFCAMVVNFMQKGDQVALHASRTIFSDVTASHWGLGYVNLAASLTVDSGGEKLKLISGVGDGRFAPDDRITLAQAATILLRVLGYTGEQTGSLWPQSYLNLASSIGLTKGVSAGANAPITRAQAARLFVNALGCKTGTGKEYYVSLGALREGAIILAIDVRTDDGSSDGAIRTAAGTNAEAHLAAAGDVRPAALVGKRGTLVLNDQEEIVTFVPDESSARTITLSGDARPSYLKGSDGQQYVMSQGTVLYTADADAGKAYIDGYTALRSGDQVTLYTENGKVVALYTSGSMTTSETGAVVVSGSPAAAMFHQLTGGAEGYRILKNRQPIGLSDLKPYDVVTYDSLSNTLTASDLRLTCVYESASPNTQAPTAITALGHTFEVLESAWATAGDVSLGGVVTLLLTADGKVAGLAQPGMDTRTTAVGMVTGGGATVFLPNGGTLELAGQVSGAEQLADQLVTISSSARGRISASRLSSRGAPGDFLVREMKLGSYPVTAGVKVYEQVDGSAMVSVGLDSLDMDAVPASKIAGYRLNSSDMVDYIILSSVTGDAYEYGMMTEVETAAGGIDWVLRRGGGADIFFAAQVGYAGRNGTLTGVVPGRDLNGGATLRATVDLKKIEGVSPTDFFERQGVQYVTAGGGTYRVADQVECYYQADTSRFSDSSWFDQATGAARLAACKAFSDDLTVYVDPVGEKVRIVAAN